jgi:hypothetical protein
VTQGDCWRIARSAQLNNLTGVVNPLNTDLAPLSLILPTLDYLTRAKASLEDPLVVSSIEGNRSKEGPATAENKDVHDVVPRACVSHGAVAVTTRVRLRQ